MKAGRAAQLSRRPYLMRDVLIAQGAIGARVEVDMLGRVAAMEHHLKERRLVVQRARQSSHHLEVYAAVKDCQSCPLGITTKIHQYKHHVVHATSSWWDSEVDDRSGLPRAAC